MPKYNGEKEGHRPSITEFTASEGRNPSPKKVSTPGVALRVVIKAMKETHTVMSCGIGQRLEKAW